MSKARHPAYNPTDEDRKKVRIMIGVAGLTLTQVAKVMGVSPTTIKEHYRAEIDVATAEATSQVAASLFKVATTPGAPGQVRAAEFWLRSRARWSTTDVLEIRANVVANEAPMLASLSNLDLDQLRSLEQITTVLYDSTKPEEIDDCEEAEAQAAPAEEPREVQATVKRTRKAKGRG